MRGAISNGRPYRDGRKLGESRGSKAGISVVACENEVRWQRRAGFQLIDTRQSTFQFSKLGEQSENVYENKGTLRGVLERSRNVYENKGT